MIETVKWFIYLLFPNGTIQPISVAETDEEAMEAIKEARNEVEKFMAVGIDERGEIPGQLDLPF